MEAAGSAGVEFEELFPLEMLSRSSTHCTVWATAVSALVTAWEGEDFMSFCTVAKADWAVERLPEPRALPRAAMSVESCEAPEELLLVEAWEGLSLL